MLVLLAALSIVAAPALAQRLNLGRDDTPEPGSGARTLALADKLSRESRTPGQGASAQAASAARSLASAMLATAERAGAAHSGRAAIGRVLADAAPELESALAAHGALAPMLAADFARLEARLRAEADLPLSVLEAGVRDALAPLVRALGPEADIAQRAGWISVTSGGAPLPIALTGAAAEAWAKLEPVLALADQYPTLAPSARDVRSAVGQVSAALAKRPSWLPALVFDSLQDELASALAQLLEPEQRAGGARALEMLGVVASAIALAEDLKDGTAATRLRTALSTALPGVLPQIRQQLPGASGPTDILPRLRLLSRTLALLPERPRLASDAKFIRHLKPGLRHLDRLADQSEDAMLAALPRLLAPGGSASDPAVLASITVHRGRLRDMDRVHRLNAMMSDGGSTLPPARAGDAPRQRDPEPIERFKGVADRVLIRAQELPKEDKRDDALAEMAAIERFALFAPLPGEEAMKAAPAGSAWATVTGGRSAELLALADTLRAAWVRGYQGRATKPALAEAARLEAMAEVLATLRDAADAIEAVEDSAGLSSGLGSGLARWPGWTVPGDQSRRLIAGLSDRCAEAVSALLRGEDGRAVGEVRSMRSASGDSHAAALVLGRLARELAPRMGPAPAQPMLLRAALGPPRTIDASRPVFALDLREDLDNIARAASELTGTREDAELRAYLNRLASSVLDRLDADR